MVYHYLLLGDQDQVGWEAHKQYILGMRQAAPEFRQDWKYVTGDGNVFALSYKSNAKFAVEVPAMSIPAGATVVVDALFVFRLEDSKIAEAWLQGSFSVQ